MNKRAASRVVLFVGAEPVHKPPRAVFFAPSRRRRRVLAVLLLAIALTAAAAVSLLIIAPRGGGQQPRISPNQGNGPSVTSATPTLPLQQPTDLTPLPSLPAIP